MQINQSAARSFTDDFLLQETQRLVVTQREATLALIACLEEVEARMLYAKLKYSSLWDYCVRHLGLSEGSSQRRIAAMRLGRAVPQAKQALANGALSLSNAVTLESFFANEKKKGRAQTTQQKAETLEKVSGISQSACNHVLFQASPDFKTAQQESFKPISEDLSVLKVILESKVAEQLKLLKNRLAHKFPNASYADLISYLIEDKLEQVEEKYQEKAEKKEKPQKKENPAQGGGLTDAPESKAAEKKAIVVAKGETAAAAIVGKVKGPVRTNPIQILKPTRKAIPIATLRILWKRSGGKCEYLAADGSRCESTRALESDHVRPVALGGDNDLLNLRHVCKTHNGWFAKEAFGADWMERFLPKLRRG